MVDPNEKGVAVAGPVVVGLEPKLSEFAGFVAENKLVVVVVVVVAVVG